MYSLGKVLGRGQFGTTRLAVEKATGAEYACKSISKRKLTCAPHDLRPLHSALCLSCWQEAVTNPSALALTASPAAESR